MVGITLKSFSPNLTRQKVIARIILPFLTTITTNISVSLSKTATQRRMPRRKILLRYVGHPQRSSTTGHRQVSNTNGITALTTSKRLRLLVLKIKHSQSPLHLSKRLTIIQRGLRVFRVRPPKHQRVSWPLKVSLCLRIHWPIWVLTLTVGWTRPVPSAISSITLQ